MLGVSYYLACVAYYKSPRLIYFLPTRHLTWIRCTELCQHETRNTTIHKEGERVKLKSKSGSCSWKKERNGHLFPSLVSNQKQIVVTNFRQSSRETEICSGRGGRAKWGLKRYAGVTSVNYDALLFST